MIEFPAGWVIFSVVSLHSNARLSEVFLVFLTAIKNTFSLFFWKVDGQTTRYNNNLSGTRYVRGVISTSVFTNQWLLPQY